MHVLWHDRHALGVDCAQVGVLEQANQIRLRRFLQCKDRRALKSQVILERLRELAHEPLERKLANEQRGTLLVLPNLTQCDCARSVAMRLLDPTRIEDARLVATRLVVELPRCLAS